MDSVRRRYTSSGLCILCGRGPRSHLDWCSPCWHVLADRARKRGHRQGGDRVQRVDVDHRQTIGVLVAWDALATHELRIRTRYKPGMPADTSVPLADIGYLLDAIADLRRSLDSAIARTKESVRIVEHMDEISRS